MSPASLTHVPAPAKLNLFLHVVGRRADGYHLLQSLFVLIDWCDDLHFERRSDGRLARHDLGVPLPADDLCLRAARALQAASGTRFGADISIDKRLPSGAGLGGGSSDAASTLLALNRLWGLDWRRERLLALALGLGADVSFVLGAGNAFVEGIGERLTPVVVPAQWFAVLKPAAGVETRAVFECYRQSAQGAPAILSGSLEDASWAAGAGRNDLQAAAESLCPDVTHALQLLQARFGNSRMTGSGSAVFARAGTGGRPEATWPVELPAGWVGRMCRSLEAHALVGWAAD